MDKLYLKLYIAGDSNRSRHAVTNLRGIFELVGRSDYELKIIDVLEEPQLADEEKIMATPTLIRVLPPPMRRLIGDLSDTEVVLRELDLLQNQKQRRSDTREQLTD